MMQINVNFLENIKIKWDSNRIPSVVFYLLTILIIGIMTYLFQNTKIYIENYVNKSNEGHRVMKIEEKINQAWNDCFLPLSDNILPVIGEQRVFVSEGNPDTIAFDNAIDGYNNRIDNFVYDANIEVAWNKLLEYKQTITQRANEPFEDDGTLISLHLKFLESVEHSKAGITEEAKIAESAYKEKINKIIKNYNLKDIINKPESEAKFYTTSIWEPNRTEKNIDITENVSDINYKPQISEDDHTAEDKKLADEINAKISTAFDESFSPLNKVPKTRASFTAVDDVTAKYKSPDYEFRNINFQGEINAYNMAVQTLANRGEEKPSEAELKELYKLKTDLDKYIQTIYLLAPNKEWDDTVNEQIKTANEESRVPSKTISAARKSFADKKRQIFAEYNYNIESLPVIVDIDWAIVHNILSNAKFSRNPVDIKFSRAMFEAKENIESIQITIKGSFANANYFCFPT